MTPLIDHVTIAGADLAALQQGFTNAGLTPDYGGVHSNGVTHMAALGFDDGSYLELISTVEPGKESPWWPKQIAADGGPCAWCARTGVWKMPKRNSCSSIRVLYLRGATRSYSTIQAQSCAVPPQSRPVPILS